MPYVDSPSDTARKDINRIAEKLLTALAGEDATAGAMAALHVALIVWQSGGATAEQARLVCNKAIDVVMTERSN